MRGLAARYRVVRLSVKIYLYLAQIVIAIALTGLVLLQAKDAGLSGMFGGGDMGIQKTRRGVERTLFNATIGVAIVFLLLALITVIVAS